MADDQLEEWLIQGDLQKERRSRIVPASTDRLTSEDPGDGEAAMETVISWLDTDASLPVIEFAVLSPQTITVTFAEETILPEPWVSPLEDPFRPHDKWAIAHHDAVSLSRGQGYGWQASGLTGLGTLSDGNRLLVSTCRWEILQIAGTEKWTRDLMLTQVMSQAAEPWSTEHDIWLIGFGDMAEKLTSFLSGEHPPHRFRTAKALSEVGSEDLKGTTATVYVMGSTEETEMQFRELRVDGVGMITDRIVTDKAMFLTESDRGVGVLGPFSHKLEIWPNLREDLVEKMEQAWHVTEELARQKAAAADFSQLLEPAEKNTPEEKTAEQIKADFDALMAQSNVGDDGFATGDADDKDLALTEPSDPHIENESTELQTEEGPLREEGQPDPSARSEEHPVKVAEADDQDVEGDSGASDAANASTGGTGDESDAVMLSLLGAPRAETRNGALTGRHAAALIILEMTSEAVPVQQISATLWPGDDTEGHTARTRRSRLLSKIRSHAGDIITIKDEGWSIESTRISTDYRKVIDVLTNESIDHAETIIETCRRIARPLEGGEGWADQYREQVTTRITEALMGLKARAIEAEAFDIAKAAKAASITLKED
ncbi:hypothetical protein ACT3TB_16270 [Micrococcaceae sp. AOP34-BR2-30]